MFCIGSIKSQRRCHADDEFNDADIDRCRRLERHCARFDARSFDDCVNEHQRATINDVFVVGLSLGALIGIGIAA